jgi:hypothetical protein
MLLYFVILFHFVSLYVFILWYVFSDFNKSCFFIVCSIFSRFAMDYLCYLNHRKPTTLIHKKVSLDALCQLAHLTNVITTSSIVYCYRLPHPEHIAPGRSLSSHGLPRVFDLYLNTNLRFCDISFDVSPCLGCRAPLLDSMEPGLNSPRSVLPIASRCSQSCKPYVGNFI